ncbi:Protein-methionine-sulfoxide reductase catalytic subunit MsrP [Zhongshania aliphaticivorans]|uniref:Protein-methionine-sulfoxide reductase catalytic subunit MsrP n=1 Tax=Zhongshania aliphaticivorans TaxID=1470434 RepID=A0A5S9QHE6_9GAMM|nr:protein-methionine-sulfoxide reductase catalytic subunit MsrP [Zhongshania aliphaticivorans]CAA0109213.1 Protein-methionine-sulfoxide reductase catalytic subunit MsrP [Zhongshania aliphaticivorans]CAA0117461.1 Protein-methionine-sulfoxide reductase catalytic subunit MsrP [Zhongshania aliphaticivorans]
MLIRSPSGIPSSEITPESVYLERRQFMQGLGVGAIAMAGLGLPSVGLAASDDARQALAFSPVAKKADNPFYTDEKAASFVEASSYNNFYEFGTNKTDPAKHAHTLTTDPWSVQVEGHVAKPGSYPLEDILKLMTLEERIYRLRCVEAWSMVIPWVGFSLADLISVFEPTSDAKYIEFTTLHRREEMRGQRSAFSTIDWPYTEGLRMDEAMNPLAFMSVGMYGKTLPNQNGAPIRLVVPWKYGFKSIKSIVKLRFTSSRPKTSWESIAPSEYGFYANVNPTVSHPRWSQAYERRLPSSLLRPSRIKTEMFNGYGDQVAGLYKGMNLRRYY